MKRALLASTALCAFVAQGAFAADLPTTKGPAPAPVAAPFSWTGFYVGANLGGLWSRDSAYESGASYPSDKLTPSGVVGGLQAGYNYQIRSFVLGVEGDVDRSSAKSNDDVNWILFDRHSASLPFFADLRGRLGVAFDRFLPYVTGGVVVADIQNKADSSTSSLDRGSSSTGWTVGAGLEYAIDAHWSVKADYLYMQFPDVSKSSDGYAFKLKDSAQVARAGINYRF
jgi:outer membrane immunogenic protein